MRKVKLKDNQQNISFIEQIKEIIFAARQKAYTAVNSAMVEAYWLMGKRIVEEEQNGKKRAAYGEEIIKTLSVELTKEFGKGFSERSIWQYRQFYQMFPEFEILRSPIAESQQRANYLQSLNWTQIQRIMRVSDPNARVYYLKEAAENHWSV